MKRSRSGITPVVDALRLVSSDASPPVPTAAELLYQKVSRSPAMERALGSPPAFRGCRSAYIGATLTSGMDINDDTVEQLRRIADQALNNTQGQRGPQQRERWGVAAGNLFSAAIALDAALKGTN